MSALVPALCQHWSKVAQHMPSESRAVHARCASTCHRTASNPSHSTHALPGPHIACATNQPTNQTTKQKKRKPAPYNACSQPNNKPNNQTTKPNKPQQSSTLAAPDAYPPPPSTSSSTARMVPIGSTRATPGDEDRAAALASSQRGDSGLPSPWSEGFRFVSLRIFSKTKRMKE